MSETKIPSQLDTETNPRLIEFMEKNLDSLVKWDLLQFFFSKPDLMGPAPKIASLTGRDLRRVEAELKDMATKGLLDVHEKSGVRLYQLAENRETRAMIEQFLRACDNRQFREAAIYHTVMARR